MVERTFWCEHREENLLDSYENLSDNVIDYVMSYSETNDEINKKIEMLRSSSNGKPNSNQSLKYSTICLVKAGILKLCQSDYSQLNIVSYPKEKGTMKKYAEFLSEKFRAECKDISIFDFNIHYTTINPEDVAKNEKYPFVTIHAICCFGSKKGRVDLKKSTDVNGNPITPCPSYFRFTLENKN